jgi:cytochrome d ubiquinol oxidase subunit I
VLGIYAILTVVTIAVLRRMTRSAPIPAAPQEADVEAYTVA